MQKVTDLFIQNIKNFPIWVNQVIKKEIFDDLNNKLEGFTELVQADDMFQYMCPKVTFKGKEELHSKALKLSNAYYLFLEDLLNENTIFEITVKNSWTLADTAKMFIRMSELEFISIPDFATNKNVAIAMFIAGKLKTGEFLKRIGRIDALKLEQAIRYQKQLNDEGRHIKMASILIKLGFITDKGLDSILILKEDAKKRMPANIGATLTNCTQDGDDTNQVLKLQNELARLENENAIMRKRLKKLLNL